MNRSTRAGLFLVAMVAMATSAATSADLQVQTVENPLLQQEAELYRQYCSACHGQSGQGDGIVAPFMDPPPLDLTAIKENFGGQFPRYLVVMAVDGSDTVRAHGASDMPVWGEVFAEQFLDQTTARAKARGKVMKIVDYVESLQR